MTPDEACVAFVRDARNAAASHVKDTTNGLDADKGEELLSPVPITTAMAVSNGEDLAMTEDDASTAEEERLSPTGSAVMYDEDDTLRGGGGGDDENDGEESEIDIMAGSSAIGAEPTSHRSGESGPGTAVEVGRHRGSAL